MSKIRIAINGFGRIGRMFYRVAHKVPEFEIVAINDLMSAETARHLLKYDSVHRRCQEEVILESDRLITGKQSSILLHTPDPEDLPWKDMDIDIVVESTGRFTRKEDAARHLQAGARKVLISAPAQAQDDSVPYIVLGVNDDLLRPQDSIFSIASCTTNNVAPLIKILDDFWEIERVFITTVHSYTRDQNILDGPHRDLRRGRSAALSIVPTTTGAAKAVTKIFPHIAANLGGAGIRVPVPDGSLTDVTCNLKKETSVEEVNRRFKEASETYLKGILEYIDEPIVSMDIIGNPHSAVFDSLLTAVIGEKNKLVKVVAWYDNEVGYSNRLKDFILKLYSLSAK